MPPQNYLRPYYLASELYLAASNFEAIGEIA